MDTPEIAFVSSSRVKKLNRPLSPSEQVSLPSPFSRTDLNVHTPVQVSPLLVTAVRVPSSHPVAVPWKCVPSVLMQPTKRAQLSSDSGWKVQAFWAERGVAVRQKMAIALAVVFI